MKASPPAASRSNMAGSRCALPARRCARPCVDLAGKRLGAEAGDARQSPTASSVRPDGRKVDLWRAGPRRRSSSRGHAKVKAEAVRRPTPSSASRWSVSTSRARSPAGVAYVQDLRFARHDPWPRRASAELWGEAPDHRRSRGQGDARRRRRRARRQLPRRHRRARGAGDQGRRRPRAKSATWTPGPPLPDQAGIYDLLLSLPDEAARHQRQAGSAARRCAGSRSSRRPTAGPTRPMPRSVRPARSPQFKDGKMTVWNHSQGVFPLRGNLAWR